MRVLGPLRVIFIFPAGSSPQNGPGKQDGGPPGVTLVSVTKEYEPHQAAVRDLTFTFHRDQITALLGTNGAGKSTVMCVPVPRVKPGLRSAVACRAQCGSGAQSGGRAPAGAATCPWPPAPAGLGKVVSSSSVPCG